MILSAMLLAGMIVMAQSFTLKGKVTDDEGNALELATVSCLEQAEVTMTNLKGEFQIKLRSADSVVVKFSMIGYKSKTRVLRHPAVEARNPPPKRDMLRRGAALGGSFSLMPSDMASAMHMSRFNAHSTASKVGESAGGTLPA